MIACTAVSTGVKISLSVKDHSESANSAMLEGCRIGFNALLAVWFESRPKVKMLANKRRCRCCHVRVGEVNCPLQTRVTACARLDFVDCKNV